MNIIFAVNDSYIDQLCTAIVSIMENNPVPINFYILNNDFSEASRKKLSVIGQHYPNCSISCHGVASSLFKPLKLNIEYITLETYYRYVIAETFPQEDKALYLDADLIANGPLQDLWDTNLQDAYCAGARDLYIEELNYKQTIGLKKDELYINAGVLLLNLKQIRQDQMTVKLFANTQALAGQISFQDQDIINITFRGKIKELPSLYNFASANVKKEKQLRKTAVIIHYTGKEKPWQSKCSHKMKKLWHKYAKLNSALQKGKKPSRFAFWRLIYG